VLRGYIATFQPDFLVKPTGVFLPAGIFPDDRVLEVADVLRVPQPGESVASQSPVGYGLDMMDIYRDAYRKVYRFVQRHPRKYQVPTLRGKLRLLGAYLWGAFPAGGDLAYYRRGFEDVFQAKAKVYNALDTLLPGIDTPLSLTAYRLEHSGRVPEPCVFLFDESKPINLIDFWNLRACGGLCMPLPISVVGKLTPEIKKFMDGYLRRWAVNDKLTYPHLIGSRGLEKAAIKDVIASLGLDRKHRVVWGHYPRLWAKQEASWDQATPASFRCDDEFRHIETEGDQLTFDAMHPDFAARFGRIGPRWMNVVSMHEYQPERLPASVIPDGIERVGRIFDQFQLPGIWTNDDGIAIPCEYQNWRHYLKMPDACRIGEEWIGAKGYKMELSNSGHILQSMVNVAGGLFHGRWFANEEIIRALGRMAERDAEGRVMAVGEFRGIVEKANQREKFLKGLTDRHLEYFKDKGVLRLCLKVQCPHCRQYPWYTLEELAHQVECHHCLQSFAFPVAAPPTIWGYRSVGPFSSAGYAQGAYSVFLAMRFLTEQLDARTTCVPSCKLTKDSRELEVDLICFWQKQSWRDPGRHIIFGECKCFGDFEEKDIRRMKEVANRFPGSIAAFCTLKTELSPGERRLIARFAESGRRPRQGRSWPVPVLVLTANELCVMTPDGVHYQWGASNAKGLAARMPSSDLNMLDLCSASQQEYLGLSSWYDWRKHFYERKAKRRKGSQLEERNIPGGIAPESLPAPPPEADTGRSTWQDKQ
jgi:hypothetical protein